MANILSGTVKENGSPVSRTVRAYRRDTGALLGEVSSAGSGPAVTWNPADKIAGITLSNNDLTAKRAGGNGSVRATSSVTSGKRYFEILADNASVFNNSVVFGICTGSAALTWPFGVITDGCGISSGSTKYPGGASSGEGFTTGDVIGVAFDRDTGKVWFSKNGAWLSSGNPEAGTNPMFTGASWDAFPVLYVDTTNNYGGVARFKTADFTYAPPTGFSAWEVAGDGSFSIDTGGYAGLCQVVALDDAAGTAYNALIAGRVTPVVT